MVEPNVVEGKNKKHDVLLYALSTCIWCKMTKKLLDKLEVQYSFIFVDDLFDREEEEVMAEIRKVNPECSFPCTVIDGKAICGFEEAKIRKALS